MNRNKLNLSLLAATIVLIIGGLLINDPFSWFVSTYKTSPLLIKSIKSGDVDKLTLFQGNELLLSFIKKSNQWTVIKGKETYIADSEKIEKALNDLLEIHKYRIVTSSKDKQKNYEVAAVQGSDRGDLHLRADSNSQKLFDIYLGKNGPSYNSTLVRLESNDEIYSAKGSFRNDWKDDIEYYRDKKLVNIISANINEIDMAGRYNYTLRRNPQQKWELNSGSMVSPVKDGEIQNILKELTMLAGNSFVKEKLSTKPYAIITVKMMTGNPVQMEIKGPSPENDYHVKTTYQPEWMTVPVYKLDNIIKKPEDLKDAAPVTPKLK